MKKIFVLAILAVLCSVGCWGASPWTSGGTTVTLSGSSASKTLTITKNGNGAMANYTSGNAPWYSERANIKHIVISAGVTTIGEYAFQGISSSSADVTVPVSCTSFGSNAFANCSTVVKIFYAGSPNEWAGITFSNATAHPFGALSGANKYYFYGQTSSPTTTIVFSSPLAEIKAYTFQRCSIPGGLSIPGTVESIGIQAFYGISCSDGEIAINRKEAPTIGDYAFEGIGSNKTIFVPTGASDYPSTSASTTEIKYDWYFNPTTKAVKGETLESYGANIKWELDENGTLTLDATSGSAAKTITYSASSQYHWTKFRRLVNRIVLKGEITDVNHLFDWHYGIKEIDLDQATIPAIEKIASNSTNSYANLFNPNGKVVVNVRTETLLDATEMAKLSNAAWSYEGHLQKGLVEAAVFADNTNNSALVEALDGLDFPFTLQLGRTLSNAYYNTFCSPIDIISDSVTSIFGAETKIYSFAGTSYNEEKDELSINFNNSQDHIDAGVPYLIWPGKAVSNPSFANVTASNITTSAESVEGTHATFYGSLEPVDVTSVQISAKSFIFLQANNILNWASEGTLGGMRAYWLLTSDVPARALGKHPVMHIGQTATAVEETADAVRSKKVLRNGQIVIVRGEHMYNMQGQIIE